MKKVICLVLAACTLLSCSINASATYVPADINNTSSDNAYWGYSGETVCIDEFVADHYTMAAYYDGDIIYVITILENGETEFCWAPLFGTVRALELNLNDLGLSPQAANRKSISMSTANTIKTYSLNHVSQSTLACPTNSSTSDISPNGMIQADYDALMDELESMHGEEYTGENWAGIRYQIDGGLKYEFKENLSYSLSYVDSVAYSAGMTLGSVVADALAKIPGLTAPMKAIATVLRVAAAINTVLYESGMIANYSSDVVYYRYVLIDGSGPYDWASHVIYYDGWIDEGNPGSPYFETVFDEYNPNESIFEDYEWQKERAYENYNF